MAVHPLGTKRDGMANLFESPQVTNVGIHSKAVRSDIMRPTDQVMAASDHRSSTQQSTSDSTGACGPQLPRDPVHDAAASGASDGPVTRDKDTPAWHRPHHALPGNAPSRGNNVHVAFAPRPVIKPPPDAPRKARRLPQTQRLDAPVAMTTALDETDGTFSHSWDPETGRPLYGCSAPLSGASHQHGVGRHHDDSARQGGARVVDHSRGPASAESPTTSESCLGTSSPCGDVGETDAQVQQGKQGQTAHSINTAKSRRPDASDAPRAEAAVPLSPQCSEVSGLLQPLSYGSPRRRRDAEIPPSRGKALLRKLRGFRTVQRALRSMLPTSHNWVSSSAGDNYDMRFTQGGKK